MKTLIATPLKDSEGKIIGVLEAVNKLNGVFNKEDEEFINLIGQQTNNILKNCSNYEKVISNCYKMQNLLKVLFFQKKHFFIIYNNPDTNKTFSNGKWKI